MLTIDKVLDGESSVAECQDVDNGNETNEINEAYEINNATRIDQTHLIRPIFWANLVFIFLVPMRAPNSTAPASPPWRGCGRRLQGDGRHLMMV